MSHPANASFESFDSFEDFFEQAEKRPGYAVELAKLEFTRKVLDRMAELGLKKGQLAAALGAKPALVTRLLSGRNNFELGTMVRLARALDCEFRCHLQPRGTTTMWIDVLDEEAANNQTSAWEENFKVITRNPLPIPADECLAIAA
jgi:plasmid maintenance system antidote protein VapI